jgi:hypothetical protein
MVMYPCQDDCSELKGEVVFDQKRSLAVCVMPDVRYKAHRYSFSVLTAEIVWYIEVKAGELTAAVM